MEQCNYWWSDDSTQWCELIDTACNCGGQDKGCTLKGKAITSMVKEEEAFTLEQATAKERKRRMKQTG